MNPSTIANNCSSLYSPEPDVAGQAVFISFLAHTSVFLVLALVITPIVQLYIPVLRPEDEWHEAGEVEVAEVSSSAARTEARGQTIVSGAPGEPRRLIYRCYCREAIQDTYTSQYIAGIAFVVTAFVKINTISYYHLRVIYCLLAMNSIIGVASNFDRDSRLRFQFRAQDRPNRPKKWKMIDFVYTINLAVFLAFSVYIFVRQDQNFSRCYKHNRLLVFATWFWFFCLSGSTSFRGRGFRSAAFWLLFFLAMVGFVGFQSWQIWVLTRTFRKKSVAPGDTDENKFTFGQILVLFMVVPLIGDFFAALMVDLRRMEGRNWNDARTALLNIFRVLVPYFVRNVVEDVRDAGRKLRNSAFIQGIASTVVGFMKNSFKQICKVFGPGADKRSKLQKTNTSRLESQENILLPTPPPTTLQLPRNPSNRSSHLDGIDEDGHPGQERSTNIRRSLDPDDPDAILPLPGSVRQRQSFPHEPGANRVTYDNNIQVTPVNVAGK